MTEQKKGLIVWSLYVLIKNDKPIYVGVSSDIIKRTSNHRANKNFDSVHVIKKYKDKKEAYCAENSLIRFNSLFNIGLINAKNIEDEFYGAKLTGKY